MTNENISEITLHLHTRIDRSGNSVAVTPAQKIQIKSRSQFSWCLSLC